MASTPSAPATPYQTQAPDGARRGRPVTRVLLAVLLGALTTLSVAWGLAAWLPVHSSAVRNATFVLPTPNNQQQFSQWLDGRLPVSTGILESDGGHRQPWLVQVERPGTRRVLWFAKERVYNIDRQYLAPDGASSAATACWSFATGVRATFVSGPVPIPSEIQDEIDDPTHYWGVAQTVTGWPFEAFSAEIAGIRYDNRQSPPERFETPEELYEVHNGIELAQFGGRTSLADHRVLPLRPRWGGLITNVALFSAAWWLVLFIPHLIFRRVRTHAGLCAACGYNLRGLDADVCPECGAPLTPSESASDEDSTR